MAGTGAVTRRIQFPVPLGGVLDESSTQGRVGDSGGNVAHQNLIYRRGGAWGVRPGSFDAYQDVSGNTFAPPPFVPLTGKRWYRTRQSLLTQLIVAAGTSTGGVLYAGLNPGGPTSLPPVQNFNTSALGPATYASVYDPVVGGDVLIICGPGGAGLANIGGLLSLFMGTGAAGTLTAGDVITVTVVTTAPAAGTVLTTYTVTAADNAFSLGTNLATAINNGPSAFGGGGGGGSVIPALSQVVATAVTIPGSLSPQPESIIKLTALNSAVVGTIKITSTNGMWDGGPTTPTSLTSSVAAVTGPYKWNGTALTQVSGPINYYMLGASSGSPSGCVSWHSHVWYWGVSGAPNTLYASDINAPENCSFMIQNGPYQIGQGDGDPGIQACVPIGNILYVFKTNSIYAITGYDFQPGEYQFNVQPAIQNTGIPSPLCVATLRDALVFWNGTSFRRLAPGALETEDIGLPLALTQGQFSAAGSAKYVQAIAGSFRALTELTNEFGAPGNFVLNNCAYFAMSSSANGVTEIAMYDDDASSLLGGYAWSLQTPPATANTVTSGLVAFGGGLDSTLTTIEPPQLYTLGIRTPGNTVVVMAYGGNARADNGVLVPFSATTGWITNGTPALVKELHQIYLNVQATAGVIIQVTARAAAYTEQNQGPSVYPAQTITLGTTRNSIGTAEQYQTLLGTFKPFLRGPAYQFVITWTGPANAQCEILAMVLDFGEQNFQP